MVFSVCVPQRAVAEVDVIEQQKQILEDRVECLEACFFAICIEFCAQAFDGAAKFDVFVALFFGDLSLFLGDLNDLAKL